MQIIRSLRSCCTKGRMVRHPLDLLEERDCQQRAAHEQMYEAVDPFITSPVTTSLT